MAPKYEADMGEIDGVESWRVKLSPFDAVYFRCDNAEKLAREYAAWLNSRRKHDAYNRYVALLACGKCDDPETEAIRDELGIRRSIDQVSP